MPTLLTSESTPVRQTGGRHRRAIRRVSVVALTLGCVAILVACTPSGYKAEKAAVRSVHLFETGQNVALSSITCNEFSSQAQDRYDGICTAAAESWAVSAQYDETHTSALITVGKWDGSMGGGCEFRKSGDDWVIQSCW